MSPLAIAEWIEIRREKDTRGVGKSPLAIAEWIEINNGDMRVKNELSPLAIAEWIEIGYSVIIRAVRSVSASDSGVD